MTFQPVHLAKRFFGSLRTGVVTADDRAWAHSKLSEAEQRLFDRMSRIDQRHALEVAHGVEISIDTLDESMHRVVFAAALLHDVGKSAADLGTYGRVVATLSAMVGGRDLAELWQRKTGFTRKVGLYLRYGEIGADMLRMAGSDPFVVAWSTEHHMLTEEWTVPADAGAILVAADE